MSLPAIGISLFLLYLLGTWLTWVTLICIDTTEYKRAHSPIDLYDAWDQASIARWNDRTSLVFFLVATTWPAHVRTVLRKVKELRGLAPH